MMKPKNAMKQAGMTAIEYTAHCLEWIEKKYPELSDEAKLQCTSTMALAASINYATTVFSGSVTSYPGMKVVTRNENLSDFAQ